MKKHMISKDARKDLRTWQKEFVEKKFCPNVNDSDHNLYFANCCTGSGKSIIGYESVIQTILFNETLGKKTINVFVAPTIMLSNQIKAGFEEYIKKYYPNLKNTIDLSVFNCESTDNRINLSKQIFWAKNSKIHHYVVSYCSDSFFGNKTIGNRYDSIYDGLKKTIESNNDIVCGTIVFDESHNYTSKWSEITGYRATSSTNIIPAEDDVKILTKLFSNVVCMSGTPNVYQCWMSKDERWEKDFVVSVNYATAIKNNWILNPDLYVIMVNDIKTGLENAAIAANKHEHHTNGANIVVNGVPVSNQTTHMLVNCPTIELANSVGDNLWKYYNKKIGVSILHSKKTVNDVGRGKNSTYDLTAKIDGVQMGSKEAKDSIMRIDVEDISKDRIVTQVEMISEGINVNSFDCAIITKHNEVSNIQQIGRILRRFRGKNHASVYCVAENQHDVADLVIDLVNEGLDLQDVLSKIKICELKGNSEKTDDNKIADYDESSWKGYTEVEIKSLMDEVNGRNVEMRVKNYIKKNISEIDFLYKMTKISDPKNKEKKSSSSSSAKSGGKKGSGKKKNNTGKKSNDISPTVKLNSICRSIENRFTKSPDWGKFYFYHMDRNEVINFMLNDVSGGTIGDVRLNSEQASIFRTLIEKVFAEMEQLKKVFAEMEQSNSYIPNQKN